MFDFKPFLGILGKQIGEVTVVATKAPNVIDNETGLQLVTSEPEITLTGLIIGENTKGRKRQVKLKIYGRGLEEIDVGMKSEWLIKFDGLTGQIREGKTNRGPSGILYHTVTVSEGR